MKPEDMTKMDENNPGDRKPRVAYVNGKIVPENEATVSIRDLGLVYGDCVYDTARTFNGKLFRLEEHVDRLFNSLKYARIDPGMSPTEIVNATEEVVRRNLDALPSGEDFWVTQRITSGLQNLDGEPNSNQGATVIIECVPLPLRARASYFSNGIDAIVSRRKRISPDALSPNAKTNNYLNMMLAQREVQANHPGAWALMCDVNGNLSEGAGCNLFVVSGGTVYTPSREFVLPGVSRQIAIDICRTSDIPIEESDISVDFVMAAQEAFLTSTSLCACPVRTINQKQYPESAPGPITSTVMDEFSKIVGMDYVAQYLQFLGKSEGSTGL